MSIDSPLLVVAFFTISCVGMFEMAGFLWTDSAWSKFVCIYIVINKFVYTNAIIVHEWFQFLLTKCISESANKSTKLLK